ncbi:MAG: hypothetical protein OYH76_21015 [Defluviicoccus sp.]|nr:hypothetical protein [Defluviicoccus sp.]
MRKPRARPTGRSYTISCTDGEWEAVKAGAARAGKRVSPWFVECALNVDPWPERHRRLVLDEKQQRAVVRGVGEIARGLGAEPAPVTGQAAGTPPQFVADLRELFERRLRRMAARGRREEAMSLLREAVGEERAEAIAAAVIPEASTMTETPVPPEKPEEGATGEQPGPDPRPGTDAEPQGSLL